MERESSVLRDKKEEIGSTLDFEGNLVEQLKTKLTQAVGELQNLAAYDDGCKKAYNIGLTYLAYITEGQFYLFPDMADEQDGSQQLFQFAEEIFPLMSQIKLSLNQAASYKFMNSELSSGEISSLSFQPNEARINKALKKDLKPLLAKRMSEGGKKEEDKKHETRETKEETKETQESKSTDFNP